MTRLERLLSIASPAICEAPSELVVASGIIPGLAALLRTRNGFTAFESALVVFPAEDAGGVLGLMNWNALDGWRRRYPEALPADFTCFAHDLFGGQFAASEHEIVKFNPETGDVDYYASSMEQWAKQILENYPHDTGWPLAHEWQTMNRPLKASERLLPRQPFVLGGDYIVRNLVPVEALDAMNKWGNLYCAIRSVPDDVPITLTGWL